MVVEDLPKVELHCHLGGIVDVAMLRELAAEGHALPVAVAALEAATPVRSLEGFLRWGDAVAPMAGNLQGYAPVLALHVERLKAQRVVYAEVMIDPSEIPREPDAAVEALQALRASMDGQEQGLIRVAFLASCNRKWTPEVMADRADTIIKLHERGLIVGVALAGMEPGHLVRPFAHSFARFRAAGLGIEVHAGEWCGPEAVWDALRHGAPHRLGHAVAAFPDPRLVAAIGERGIHLEMCPTSNLCTGSVTRIAEHPIARARALGLSAGVNTDDPGAFGCSMNGEYALLTSAFGFGPADFAYLHDCAWAARFGAGARLSM